MINPESLLGVLANNLQIKGINAQPKIEDGFLVIELTEDDVKEMALRNVDERLKKIAIVKIEDNKLKILIKLF